MSGDVLATIEKHMVIVEREVSMINDKKRIVEMNKKINSILKVLSELKKSAVEHENADADTMKNIIGFIKNGQINARPGQDNIKTVPWDIGRAKESKIQIILNKKRKKKK